MNRTEFEQLRDLPGKRITAEIKFTGNKQADPNLVFEQIPVENSLGVDVILNGTYKPEIPSITFNFVIRGTGPICRVCVNSTIHQEAGRTHKHDLQVETDPRRNLPNATARPDLEGLTAREVWDNLCRQANIEHAGTFHDPEREGV